MNSKKILIIVLALFIACISNVKAEELLESSELELDEVVAETTKYYKTVTILSNSSLMRSANMGEVHSITTEISEEEYNNVPENSNTDISPQAQTTETSYKKLTATISKHNVNYYKYAGTLTWKQIPSTRSYDIIGLGYFGSVKLANEISFTQKYCTTDDVCGSGAGYYQYKGNNGSGAMFHLPTGSLKSLSQSIHIYVQKTDPNSTVIEQELDADYAHATSTISYSAAKDFYIDTGGIKLVSNYYYYDSMNEATARWTGTW